MSLLPAVGDEARYHELAPVEATWRPALREICGRHGLPAGKLVRERTGTAIVFSDDVRVVKLYCPFWPEEHARELRGLRHWRDLAGLPVPRLLADGELEGWPYVVMTRLPGVMVREVWKDLAPADRASILRQAGGVMAGLHRDPAGADGPYDLPWDGFVASRIAAFPADQRKRGLTEAWIGPLHARLAEGAPELAETTRPLLHCDLHWDHFLVDRAVGGWRIVGLLDFADAMAGHPLYEFGAPLVYLAWGDPALRRELMLGYGLAAADLAPALSRRLFTALLLHRYLSVARCLDQICRGRARTVAELEAFFCGFDPPGAGI